ncbi:MAG: proton-conducting transporter membrane subunit, partial [Clostridia bacterium]
MNFLLLLTILFPLLCGGITFCIPDKCRKTIICFVTAPLLITAAACIYICTCEPVAPFLLFNITDTISISLYSDSLSKYFSIFSSLIWLLVGIYAFAYMKHEKNQSRFFGFMLISLGMIMALEFSANLATMYLFFEFATISSVPLVLHSLTKPAVSAALKYLFYSIAGAFMGLLGIIFIYNYSEAESFTNFEILNKVQLGENSNMLL